MNKGNTNNVLSDKHKQLNKRKETGIFGTGTITGASAISVVEKKSILFVSRLKANTPANLLENYLKSDFPEVQCSALESKYPNDYSSFKVCINSSNIERAMKPEMWPAGAYVAKFFQKRTARADKK